MSEPIEQRVTVNGIDLNVAVAGSGPAVLLMHGFPHTWRVWEPVIPALAREHTVVAPDLRGLGHSSRNIDSFTAGDVATDCLALLDALGHDTGDVVGIDLGAPAAFLLAMREPRRVGRLVLLEAMIGTLPGAEEFLRGGAPWWFGFHAVPDLAETVLAGHGSDYVDFFLDIGSRDVTAGFREDVHRSYTGRDSLRCAFEHYRSLPSSAREIADAVASARLTVPTMTIGANPVGATTHAQLAPLADDLVGHVLPDSRHIVPQDRPDDLLRLLLPFLAG